jgi:predicted nucleotide-binding protein (sugar kinase/HSP70/actin superfamily)
VTKFWNKTAKERIPLMERRKKIRVGIPRVLNIYTYAPLFNGYLESLGIQPENVVYSDYTSSDLYRAGASRGAIDPCFPAKIGISHVYNLIQEKHRKKPLDVIFFPMYDVLTSPLVKIVGMNACPTVTATPETVKAAFTKENDVFGENNVKYINPVLNFADRKLFAFQMLQVWQPILGLSEEENNRAVEVGYKALADYESSIRNRARQVLDELEREDRIGIVMLGRPYHHDPGLNHEIMEEFQKLGYPIFSQNTLPLDEDLLERLFGEEVRAELSRTRSTLRTPGKIRIRAARTTRFGQRSLPRGIRTWLRSRFPASNAGTMRRFTAWSKALSSNPVRRISASRI